MPTKLRQCRLFRRGPAGTWTVGVGLAFGLMVGCESSTPREPIPNPPLASPPVVATAPNDDDAGAEQYLKIKARFEADPTTAQGPAFASFESSLRLIANGAAAKPLRANAALLLGAMLEIRGEPAQAAAHYEHAATLIPDDAGPFMALALAYASAGRFDQAVRAQEDAARLDPDNLENWLALGELRLRAGDQAGGVQAYIAYEKRRKGLIDGLTLHDKAGQYRLGEPERIGCAQALAAAADQGTAVALIYALRRDPAPDVRATVAAVMGIHRLTSYIPVLQTQANEETDPAVREAVRKALAEIAADPVTMEPTERPRLGRDDPRATPGEIPKADAPEAPPVGDRPPSPASSERTTPTPDPPTTAHPE